MGEKEKYDFLGAALDPSKVAIVILAAGKGTRMKSELPKVLHLVNGKSMINRVVRAALSAFSENIVVVVGHQWQRVKSEIEKEFPTHVDYALQEKLLGTGDAVKCSTHLLNENVEHVMVLCGDVPLIQSETLQFFASQHDQIGNDISVLAIHVDDPKGYGRIIADKDNNFIAIREEKDATQEEKQVQTVNAGVYCIKKEFLIKSLKLLHTNNAQKEYYLTDLISICISNNGKTGFFVWEFSEEFQGVNTSEDLKKVESLLEERDR